MAERDEPGTTRRVFIDGAVAATAATAAFALTEGLPRVSAAAPRAVTPAASPSPGIPAGVQELVRIGQIRSHGRRLRAVMTVRSGPKLIQTGVGTYLSRPDPSGKPVYPKLRYFHGRGTLLGEEWPLPNAAHVQPPPPPPASGPPPTPAGPGPTLRCTLGDNVEITLLNHVNVAEFGGTLDAGETGKATGCDTVTFVGGDPNLGPGYPGNDRFPDCLHGSSSANLHFHGTHVTPSTTGDNVLVNVRPNRKVTERDVAAAFADIFDYTEKMGHSPQHWDELPAQFRSEQEKLLKEYDRTAPWKGGRGLPPDQALWPQNKRAIDEGVWPQWYVGAYPYSFHVPKYTTDAHGNPTSVTMGQSPGTHWYHSHKHGSTAINMFNGLSGALIITDDSPTGYDGKLNWFYAKSGHALEEVVLVFQQLLDLPNLMSTNPTGPSATLVNGQFTPKITMKAGQVQLWRMINSCPRNTVAVNFVALPGTSAPVPTYKQTAQDGVQFDFLNYNDPSNGDQNKNLIIMAAANRVDLLVQAPLAPGSYAFGTAGPDGQTPAILYVEVTGTAISPMGFPKTRDEFPKRPTFLNDIDPQRAPTKVRLRRTVEYGWSNDPPGRMLPDKSFYHGNLPHFTINGKQFQDSEIDEVMLLGTTEEWTLVNATTKIAHPFHIHINPFQIFEIFDPSVYSPPGSGIPTPAPGPPTPNPPALFNTKPVVLTGPFIWWDTFAIPAGVYLPAGTIDPATGKPPIDPLTGKPVPLPGILPGYFKMRSRFVDFTGLYVQHCHILAHEDRGMMQLLEVVSNRTILKHH